jgi:hypothetical protein
MITTYLPSNLCHLDSFFLLEPQQKKDFISNLPQMMHAKSQGTNSSSKTPSSIEPRGLGLELFIT